MAEQSKTRVISLEYPPSNPFICHLWLISIISVDLWLHINYPCCYFTSTERITQLTAGGIEYILPSKPLLRKISSKLHKLYLQKFFNHNKTYSEKLKQEIYDNILIIINERNYKIKDVHKLKYKGKTIYEYKIILNKYFSNRCFKQHLFFMKPASCEYFQIFVKLCNR